MNVIFNNYIFQISDSVNKVIKDQTNEDQTNDYQNKDTNEIIFDYIEDSILSDFNLNNIDPQK